MPGLYDITFGASDILCAFIIIFRVFGIVFDACFIRWFFTICISVIVGIIGVKLRKVHIYNCLIL